jgi:phospholipase D1/2
MIDEDFEPASIFQPGVNCWRVERANHASVLVDYGNYYRDLHAAICKAKESIFVLGWDIDGRIELLRGPDAEKSEAPVTFFELIKWKIEREPQIKIYLNKWDYSIFFAKEREPLARFRWNSIKSENFHYCIDSMLPIGACHHQKVVVIDDETAFCGGMDIALARWDHREHHPVNEYRYDPGGIFNHGDHIHYAPYHDLMLLTSGDAAQALGELVRERWRLACRCEAIPLIRKESREIPPSWPQGYAPDFKDIQVAIARTLPPLHHKERTEEIHRIFIDEIAKARTFIYIENQFLVQLDIARAINMQLRNNPDLRVLAISCDHPKGVMEAKSMWAPRLEFREEIESGGVGDRVALVYPISREDGKEDPVRIHSKLMIVDDKFLHLGSANINNRSMGMDTECDQIIAGSDSATRDKIRAVRNDLIREHSGREAAEIDRLIEGIAPLQSLLQEVPTSRQHFRRIDDERYRHERFVTLAKIVSDPRRPLVTADLTVSMTDRRFLRHLSRPFVWIACLCLFLSGLAYLWSHAPADWTDMDQLSARFERIAESSLAIPLILAVYVLSGFVMFPITVLIGATAAAFGPIKGFAVALAGTLLAAAAGFLAGRGVGFRIVRRFFGARAQRIKEKVDHSGIIGMSLVRMVPVAPFGVVNIVFGMASASFLPYMLGTFLGLLPGLLALAILGDSLFKLFSDPSPERLLYLALGVIVWLAVIFLSHRLEKKFNRKQKA